MTKNFAKLISIVTTFCLLCSASVLAAPIIDKTNNVDQFASEESLAPKETKVPEEVETEEIPLDQADTETRQTSQQPNMIENPNKEEYDENGLPVGYDQSVIDAINNNIVDLPIEVLPESNTLRLAKDSEVAALASDDTMKDEYQAEIVTSPFNIKNSNNESVSLSTGALTLQKNVLSLPGKNGLDFDLTINYNSGNAVISESKYNNTNLGHEILTDFAIGWSFNFPKLDLGYSPYGYPKAPTLQLSDGSSYEVDGTFTSQQSETECTLRNYLLDDMKLVRTADRSEFILTYSDSGRVDTFDGEYGNIKEIKDRFGNTISFQYEERDFYQGTFFDYFFKPSSKLKKARVLTQITDSIGRHIHINYHDSTVLTGKKLDYIEIILEDTPILKLNIDQEKGYYGDVDVLASITEADGLTTRYTYEEKITHKTDVLEKALSYFEKPSYYGNGSYYVLTHAEYPTGGYSDYQYLPARRSYGKVVNNEIRTAWYEVYKISKCSDSTGDVTTYDYEGDRSGYPVACPIPSNIMDPDYVSGDIYTLDANEEVNYHTIVRKNDLCTIYTFDKKHNLIHTQKLDDTYEISTYLKQNGTSEKTVVVYNELYSLSAYMNQIQFHKTHLYEHNVQRPDEFILPPINFGSEKDTQLTLVDVKSIMNNIYIFYCVKNIDSTKPEIADYYGMRVYNVNTDEWYDEELDFEIQKVFSAGRYLFTCKSSAKGDSLTSIFDEQLGYWVDISTPALLDKDYMFSYGDEAYFKSGDTVVRLNLATKATTSKTISEIKNAGSLGFETGGNFYVYTYPGKIYTFNFDAGTASDTGCRATSRILAYGSLYCCESGKVKRLNITNGEKQWKDYTYNLFPDSSTEMLAGYNMMYIKAKRDVSTKYEVSYEKINLDPWGNEHRIGTEYAYNEYRQQTGQTAIAYKYQDGQMYRKTQYSETTEYEPGHNAVRKMTDRLGNITEYEYVNSPHYIPTKITQRYKNGPTIVTDNVLLDANRISEATTIYSDREIKTVYTYSSSSPGNVASETVSEIKDDIAALISKTEYLYNTDPSCPGEAYVTQKILAEIQTNDESYNKNKILNQITNYTYYWQRGQLKSETVGGRTTSYEYNDKGWPTKTTNPDNTSVITVYDINGTDNPVKTIYTGKTGTELYYTIDYYDGLGIIAKQSEQGDKGTEQELKNYQFENGLLSSITDKNNNQTVYGYDVLGRVSYIVIKKADTYDSTLDTYIQYDDYDLTRTVTLGNDESQTVTYYDVAGRAYKTEVNTAAGLSVTTTDYDTRGNAVKVTDPKQNITTNSYNDLNQLLTVTDALNQSAGAAKKSTVYTYDAYGNAATVTTPGGSVTRYEYDALGRMLNSTDPEGQKAYYVYDDIGNLIKSKDRNGQEAVFQYDQMNRLTNQDKGSTHIGYTYTDLGSVETMTDETGTTQYSYTPNNLLKSMTTPDEYTISYEYDPMHNVKKMTDYSQKQFTYTYDAANRLQTINRKGTDVVVYNYSTDGTLSGITTPEGTTDYSYDNALQMVSAVNKLNDGTVINSYSYEYDLAGNQTKKTDNGQVTQYGYDVLNRLESVNEPDGTTTAYTFDQNNNVMTKSVTHPASYEYSFKQNGTNYTLGSIGVDNTTYAYDANNRLLEETRYIGGDSENYSGLIEVATQNDYDPNGNLIRSEKGGQVDSEVLEYEYDALNRLVHYTDASGTRTNYTYNGQNQRTRKWNDGTTTRFYWDRGYISNERGSNSWIAANYVGATGIFARETAENAAEVTYMMKNGHGDVTALVRDGAVTKAYDYDAYGVEKNPDASDTNPFRYCAEYFDQETQNIYLRNRYYNPSNGRFLTEDPAQDGLNWYVYCGNNPVNRVDPTGYWEEGDELFPEFIQSAIIKYTEMYNYASDDDERFAAHAGAVRMRELGRKFTSRVEWGGPDFGDWEWDPDKDEIVVHHTANNENDISKIEKKHVKQGWSGVGYHFVIDQNGNVYEGRPFNAKGAHVDGNNTGKIGIALVGNFEPSWIRDNAPSEEQLRSLFRMVEALQMSAGWDMPVYGHRDYNDAMPNTTTVCPGQNLYDIIDRVY